MAGQEQEDWTTLSDYLNWGGKTSKEKLAKLATTAPLTAEVQSAEQMKAALEAIVPAYKSDAERREKLLLAAETGGKRQAAEQLIQETRGFETGTGASSGLGRRRAAEVLMEQQQIAAARAAEMPASTLADLEQTTLGQMQALPSLMAGRAEKLASYIDQLMSVDEADRANQIDNWIALEAGQDDPDVWMVYSLNNIRPGGGSQYWNDWVEQNTPPTAVA